MGGDGEQPQDLSEHSEAVRSFVDAFEGSLIPQEIFRGLPGDSESSELTLKWLRAEKRRRGKK